MGEIRHIGRNTPMPYKSGEGTNRQARGQPFIERESRKRFRSDDCQEQSPSTVATPSKRLSDSFTSFASAANTLAHKYASATKECATEETKEETEMFPQLKKEAIARLGTSYVIWSGEDRSMGQH